MGIEKINTGNDNEKEPLSVEERKKMLILLSSMNTIEEQRKIIERNAKDNLEERNNEIINSWEPLKREVDVSIFEKIVDEKGKILSNEEKKLLGKRDVFIHNDKLVFWIEYEWSREGLTHDVFVKDIHRYEIADEEYKKSLMEEQEKIFDKKKEKLPRYSWSETEQLKLNTWIEEQKKTLLKIKSWYDFLVEESKNKVLNLSRITEIEKMEKYFKEFEIPYTPWSQPKLSKIFFRETKKGECYSEDDEDEILDQILDEWGLSSMDLDDKGEVKVPDSDIIIKVKFKNPYGFKIYVEGDVQLGTFALRRTGLKEVDEQKEE